MSKFRQAIGLITSRLKADLFGQNARGQWASPGSGRIYAGPVSSHDPDLALTQRVFEATGQSSYAANVLEAVPHPQTMRSADWLSCGSLRAWCSASKTLKRS